MIISLRCFWRSTPARCSSTWCFTSESRSFMHLNMTLPPANTGLCSKYRRNITCFSFHIRDPGAQHQSLGYICSNNQKYIASVKIINFYLMPKIIRILSKDHVPWRCTFLTVNISKLHLWLVICIAKNFIWTTLKMIFLIFRCFAPSDFQIVASQSDPNTPYIHGNIIYSAFRWCINLIFRKLTLKTGLVLQGHIVAKLSWQ